MSMSSAQLLKQLDPMIRPGSVQSNGPSSRRPVEQQGFDELLAAVSKGSIGSGEPVTASPSIDPPLSTEQLDRLAKAADLAQANGAARVMMMIDDRMVLVDVATRQVESELKQGQAFMAVDAVMRVRSDAAQESGHPAARGPSMGVLPPELARARSPVTAPS